MTQLLAGPRGWLVDPEAGQVIGRRGRPIGTLDSSGYVQIHMGDQNPLVHRVIWETVHGPLPAGLEINHLNGIKTDNRIANLEAVTRGENARHAFRMGLKSNRGERHPSHRLTEEDVRWIRKRYRRYSKDANSRTLAEALGVDLATVANVILGRTWTHVVGAD